jgi:hypothetical protein
LKISTFLQNGLICAEPVFFFKKNGEGGGGGGRGNFCTMTTIKKNLEFFFCFSVKFEKNENLFRRNSPTFRNQKIGKKKRKTIAHYF